VVGLLGSAREAREAGRRELWRGNYADAPAVLARARVDGVVLCSSDINTPLLDKRQHPPSAEARARMLQPDDIADCAWLVATLPSRAVVEEISLSTR